MVNNMKVTRCAKIVWSATMALLVCVCSGLSQRLQTNSNQSNRPVNCSNISQVLDRCAALASYSHTIPGSAYPTNLEELKAACPKHQEGLTCLRQHVKCLQPLTKRAILSFIESRRKHAKRLCHDPKTKFARDFMDAFSCIRKHKRDKFIESEVMAIKRIEAILSDQVKDFGERFQRACCSINHYRQRSLEDLGPECGEARLAEAVESAIESVVGESLEYACPESRQAGCAQMRPLLLDPKPSNKSLTRAGSDLMIVLTAPDDKPSPSSKDKSSAEKQPAS